MSTSSELYVERNASYNGDCPIEVRARSCEGAWQEKCAFEFKGVDVSGGCSEARRTVMMRINLRVYRNEQGLTRTAIVPCRTLLSSCTLL